MNGSITGGDLAVWTAFIAGGSAVIAGIVGTLGGAWATSRTLRANSQLAREQFLREKQADAYVMVANHIARVRAWTNIAIDEAKGITPRFSPKPEFLNGDEWYQMSAQLRVFGSLLARVHFDQMHEASSSLNQMVLRSEAHDAAAPEDVDAAYELVNLLASRLTVLLAAEIGPLNDELMNASTHWWQFRKRSRLQRQLDGRRRLIGPDETSGE